MKTTRPNKLLIIFLFFFFATSYIYLLYFYSTHINTSVPSQLNNSVQAKSTEKVVRVIDGDTFEIEGGIRVRLIGIDTPEMKNKNKTVDCFAEEAKKKTTEILAGKEVFLEKDISETDKYGRLLRYVYLENEMLNDKLVRDGYAKISSFPPDIKYANNFLQSEREARVSKLGLWRMCKE